MKKEVIEGELFQPVLGKGVTRFDCMKKCAFGGDKTVLKCTPKKFKKGLCKSARCTPSLRSDNKHVYFIETEK